MIKTRIHTCRIMSLSLVVTVMLLFLENVTWAETSSDLRVATFDIDVSPPIGSYLAYDPVINQWDLGLRAKGIVLLGAGTPIVLCVLDWIGIANEGNDVFRQTLAEAAGTTPDRVVVHTIHQHDAPCCDFTVEKILKEYNIEPQRYDGSFPREVLSRLGRAVRGAFPATNFVTHVGLGQAKVHEVASNRRIPGPDGNIRATRYTSCKDPALRAEPEGVIDPIVSLVSLWNGDQPVVVLSYYATHPQSYYRLGIANPDFPGVARFFRQLAVPAALHIHFNGAGGNLGAGKYNDGSKENRGILAERLADGMRRAWESTQKSPVNAESVDWNVVPVMLPVGKHLVAEQLEATMKKPKNLAEARDCADRLAWLRRCQSGHKIDIACLSLGRARIFHMPGELFVEYQLAAKAVRPDLFVTMAAYGNYGTGYIGTTAAYVQKGGYETSDRATNVGPQSETVLMNAIRTLLGSQH
ncbi:MAG: hypothetical protein PHR77_06895 [Kiritimatiellae bacterium]|nr:hypothetical protein [Kiritimatiellia bacterium]MDD5520572.1 hypothetical protein [Kiritimatiellia bacterium]